MLDSVMVWDTIRWVSLEFCWVRRGFRLAGFLMVCLVAEDVHTLWGGRNDTMLSLDDFWWYLMIFDVFDYVWTIVVVTKDNAYVVKRTNEQIV